MTSSSLLVTAGAILSDQGLVTAFGHVSVRTPGGFIITPGSPLGSLRGDMVAVSLDATELPAGAPKEAWMHSAIYAAREDVNAICRAQPPWVAAVAAAGHVIKPVHGQGSFCGAEVPVHPDSRLARTPERGQRIAESLQSAPALVLQGNGAITIGSSVQTAVARMCVLEASAQLNARALAIGQLCTVPTEEQDHWNQVGDELLTRLWDHYASLVEGQQS